jgi:hypothetical protein
MNQTKIKQLLDKSKNINAALMQTHDTTQERNEVKRKMKQAIETTNLSKTYCFVIIEI